jgi:TonB family protein
MARGEYMSQIRWSLIVAVIVCCAAIALGQNNATTPSQAPPPQSQPARPQPVRVSNEVMLGRVEHKTMPIYPDDAMSKGIQGDVIFNIEVDETGKIRSSAVVVGDPLLVSASNDALKTFRFKPYLVNGTPVRVQSQLGYHFSVEKTADGVNGKVECITSIPNRP